MSQEQKAKEFLRELIVKIIKDKDGIKSQDIIQFIKNECLKDDVLFTYVALGYLRKIFLILEDFGYDENEKDCIN